ncbi:hypothetical protein L2E82_25248 [Cichorium intybus]|uniref:Uncharacterized protein n=1 Tax=Cichorium intybus TaxID=13427 RepID=A0ACB9E342_CICIN|nr:hypothetical protein L2E82_25248 [Cichorium intybus]
MLKMTNLERTNKHRKWGDKIEVRKKGDKSVTPVHAIPPIHSIFVYKCKPQISILGFQFPVFVVSSHT